MTHKPKTDEKTKIKTTADIIGDNEDIAEKILGQESDIEKYSGEFKETYLKKWIPLEEHKKAITLAKEAKAEEIKINVMNDIKIWMAGRDCDIKVIDDILGKHTK